MLVHRAPRPRRRLAVDDHRAIIRTGSQQHAVLGMGPSNLPHGTIVPGEGFDLVVVVLFDNLEDLDSACLLYTSPSPRDQRGSRMPSSA